jgi:hypothetical protein
MMLRLVKGCVASQYRHMCLDVGKSLVYVYILPLVRAAFDAIDKDLACPVSFLDKVC